MGGCVMKMGDGTLVHLEGPDVCDQQIEVDGRIWRFDFDKRFGPLWLRKDGEPRKCQFPTSKRVWDAFENWLRGYNAAAPKS